MPPPGHRLSSSIPKGLVAAVLWMTVCSAQSSAPASAKTTELKFTSHDDYPMLGKLTTPDSPGLHAAVIYVQAAEAMTVDMKRPKAGGGTYNYFDLYREKLPPIGVAFFSYEGRGVHMGDKPPRYEATDADAYNTSTLENKVRDVLSAVQLAKKQPGIDGSRIFLMGTSEGTLLAAEAAARAPKDIHGLILYGVLSVNMRESFRYILTEGGLLNYLPYFDTDKDGRISKAEFEADPRKFRQAVWNNAGFENFDVDRDGYFTAADLAVLSKPLLDAIDREDFGPLDQWAKANAGVATPANWFRDHFAQPPMWTFLAKLDMPVGLFQGVADGNVPVAGVRKMEDAAKRAGKTNLEFHYFEGLGHTLGIEAYFTSGRLPAGHKAIFEFIERQAGREQPVR